MCLPHLYFVLVNEGISVDTSCHEEWCTRQDEAHHLLDNKLHEGGAVSPLKRPTLGTTQRLQLTKNVEMV